MVAKILTLYRSKGMNPQAKNQSNRSTIFVSDESKLEYSRKEDFAWVPGPPGSKPIDWRDDWRDDEPRCMYKGWILLYLRGTANDGFERCSCDECSTGIPAAAAFGIEQTIGGWSYGSIASTN